MADLKLTKADTVALWHAVQWMALCLKESAADIPTEALNAERERLTAAKRALRKVNALRLAAPKGEAGEMEAAKGDKRG